MFSSFGSAVITSVVSGHDLSSKDVHYVRLLKAAFAKISLSTFPGMFAVNSLPILRYLPRSFPGADFHHFARGARNLIEQTLNSPFASVEKVCLTLYEGKIYSDADWTGQGHGWDAIMCSYRSPQVL